MEVTPENIAIAWKNWGDYVVSMGAGETIEMNREEFEAYPLRDQVLLLEKIGLIKETEGLPEFVIGFEGTIPEPESGWTFIRKSNVIDKFADLMEF